MKQLKEIDIFEHKNTSVLNMDILQLYQLIMRKQN